MTGIGRLIPGKDSSSATDPSGGGDNDPGNTCTRSVQPSNWTGQTDSSSIQSDGGDDYYEDYESGDGRVTATLDVTDYVKSDETIKSVDVPYASGVRCDSDAESCSVNATTTVTFSNGESESRNVSADMDTTDFPDGYSGTATTTDSNVDGIEATNGSSASITRKSGGPDVEAEAVAELVGYTKIKLECGGGGDPPNRLR